MHVGNCFSGALAAAVLATPLMAEDFGASVEVSSGSSATVTLEVEISTSFGTDTDDSTATNTVVGTGTVVVDSNTSPTTLAIPSLDFDLGSANFNYSFFCLPIIGCQGLNVSVSNFMIGLQKGGTSGAVDAAGIADFPAAPFVSSFDYQVSGLADIVGSNVVPEVYSFRTGVSADGTNVALNQLALDPIVFEIPPEDLPTAVNSVQITAFVDLSNVSLSGELESLGSPCEGDFDGDNVVGGADFGSILASWGPCSGCPQDLDGDDTVGGSDIGAFLALWGPCP